jgi:hypothetical protein
MKNLNSRCEKYVKGTKTQAKPSNINFENLVRMAAQKTLDRMGIDYWPAVCPNISDCAFEWEDGILQLDAKGCHIVDKEMCEKKDGLHIHCGVAQTSLTSTKLFNDKPQIGLQKTEIDGKPVYTFIAGLRWGSTDTGYFAESFGLANIPHSYDDVGFNVGKSDKEMRIVLKNPELWDIKKLTVLDLLEKEEEDPEGE